MFSGPPKEGFVANAGGIFWFNGGPLTLKSRSTRHSTLNQILLQEKHSCNHIRKLQRTSIKINCHLC